MTESEPVLSPQAATEWKVPRDPQISPDGNRIAFVLDDVAWPDEHARSTIWMVDFEGGDVRQFTSGAYADSSPRWSPDGAQIAFLSDRKEAGTDSLYVISAGGGEARLLVEWKPADAGPMTGEVKAGSVSDVKWSPDGKWIAFIGRDQETEEERKRKKEERRDEVVADSGYKYGRVYMVAAEGGEPRRVTGEGDFHVVDYDWSPDGTEIAAALVPAPTIDAAGHGPTKLLAYPVEGGEPRTVLEWHSGLQSVLWSPDGQTIAFLASTGRVQTHDSLFTVLAQGGEAHNLTPAYPGSILSMVWSPDSTELRFMAVQDLWGVLQTINVQDCQIRDLYPNETPEGTYESALSFDRTGRRFAIVRSFSDQPENVWAGTVDEGIHRATALNEKLAALPWVKAEVLRWTSPDGSEISGLLYHPANYEEGRRYPMVLHIHGGPAGAWTDSFMGNWHDWAQLLAMRGYAVLYPNPRGSVGRGAAFTDAEANDMGGGELRDVLAGVDRAIEMGIADPERLGVGGWSHGGYMTAWTVTQTPRFKAAVMGAGLSNLISDQGQSDIPRFNDDYYDQTPYENPDAYWSRSALAHVRDVVTPTLILHGGGDQRVNPLQGQEMYRALKRLGVETQFVTYPREPHGIKERGHQLDLMERVLGWYDRHLKY